MRRAFRVLFWAFAALYAAALAVTGAAMSGLFGAEPGPLSGIFLIPLGLPWLLALDRLPGFAGPWVAAAAPAVNLAILYALAFRPWERKA